MGVEPKAIPIIISHIYNIQAIFLFGNQRQRFKLTIEDCSQIFLAFENVFYQIDLTKFFKVAPSVCVVDHIHKFSHDNCPFIESIWRHCRNECE